MSGTTLKFRQRRGSHLYVDVHIEDKKRVADATVELAEGDIVTLLRMLASVVESRHLKNQMPKYPPKQRIRNA